MRNLPLSGILSPGQEKEATKKQGFTLVELIVVIAILAILGTIAFISLQGYSAQSRDSVRISDIGNLAKVLELSMLKGEKVPMPENKIEITASGVLIAYQGEAGEKTLNVLGMANGGKDPLEETYYTYTTNDELTKYQVMGFLEDGSEISYDLGLDKLVEAKDLSKRQVYIKGDELGLLLNSTTSEPVNRLGVNIDIAQTTDEYKAVFTTADTITGTGGEIFSNYYNRNKELIANSELAKLDENLVLYMDMETTTLSGTTTVLKDLSKYGNNGVCYNSGVMKDCGGVSGPQFIDGNGSSGNAMKFDGIDDYIVVSDSESLDINTTTILIKTKIRDVGVDKTILAKTPQPYEPYRVCTSSGRIIGQFSKDDTYREFIVSDYNYIKEDIYNVLTIGFDKNYLYIKNNGNQIISRISNVGSLRISTGDLYIGSGGLRGQFTDGDIDEIRIYNRALSETEVKTLYETMK